MEAKAHKLLHHKASESAWEPLGRLWREQSPDADGFFPNIKTRPRPRHPYETEFTSRNLSLPFFSHTQLLAILFYIEKKYKYSAGVDVASCNTVFNPFGHNWGWQGFANVWLCSHWPASHWTECAQSPRTLEFTNKSRHSDANYATACIYVRLTFSSRSLCVPILWLFVCVRACVTADQYCMECFFHVNKKPWCFHLSFSLVSSSAPESINTAWRLTTENVDLYNLQRLISN